jgi:hypothetical protein
MAPSPFSRRLLWSSAGVGLLLSAALAIAGRGTFEHRTLTLLTAGAGIALVIGAQLLLRVAGRVRAPRLALIGKAIFAAGLVCVMQIASAGFGMLIHARDLSSTRQFCEEAIARVEEVHRSTGSYPATLEEAFPEKVDLPFLFQRSGQFVSSIDGFVLSFEEADGVVPTVEQYSSERRRWTRF